jgi:Flp pilus assembly protein TadG
MMRARRGSEILELALLLPLLLWLVFGACDFGLYFYKQHNLTSAAREGARAGSLYGANDQDVTSAVNKIMTNAGFKGGDFTCTTNAPVDSIPAGGDVIVTVEMPYEPLGIPPARVHSTKVTSIVTMRKE